MKGRFKNFLEQNPSVLAYLKDKFETDEERLSFYRDRIKEAPKKFSTLSTVFHGSLVGGIAGIMSFTTGIGFLLAIGVGVGATVMSGTEFLIWDSKINVDLAHEKVQKNLLLEAKRKENQSQKMKI